MLTPLPLRVDPNVFGLVKLNPAEPVPPGVLQAAPCFVARTPDELSIVAPLDVVSAVGPSAGRFRLLQIALTFGTTEYGILKQVLDPLAAAGVWVLALGTHDTDYVLVRADQLTGTVAALRQAGHQVSEPGV